MVKERRYMDEGRIWMRGGCIWLRKDDIWMRGGCIYQHIWMFVNVSIHRIK